MTELKKINLNVEVADIDSLKAMSEKTHVRYSMLIRLAIKEYLEAHSEEDSP